ncbi:MAG: ATP-dependent Clp protease proteolytic subunit, partial [candidate division WWE3 bacterium GW2011_GWB1_42_6]
ITADNVGKPVEEVLRDMERDYWMSADETLKYGLIDKIMQPKKK